MSDAAVPNDRAIVLIEDEPTMTFNECSLSSTARGRRTGAGAAEIIREFREHGGS